MNTLIIIVVGGISAIFLPIIILWIQSKSIAEKKPFHHPTKANSNPIPSNPCFYNIGSTVYHQSKECSDFSLLDTWDAITKDEALSKGFSVCPLCRESIVFIYPRGKVYHKTKFCSDSQSIPYQVSEKEAIAKGLHPCGKCW